MSEPLPGFSPWDYSVFAATLLISLAIGVFHAFRGNATTRDFLMAGRSMAPVPVAMSLSATFLSSIAILGYVGEVYGQGLQMVWMLVGNAFGVGAAAFTSIPIFYKLQLTSINEYHERRFKSPGIRKLSSFLSCLTAVVYLGICLYAPTLALDAVTPLSLWVYIPVLGAVVTLYSSMGGLKAVVWTDAFQTVIIVAGVLFATVSAIVTVGGFQNMIDIAAAHGRTEALDFRPGFLVRHTVVNCFVLGFISFFHYVGFNHSTLQRIGSMPNVRTVRVVLGMSVLGITSLQGLLFLCGLAVFAVYADCDPMSQEFIDKKDQILPFYVMQHLGKYPGVPGLFVACLFCGTLSSISSVLNSTAAQIWMDFMSEIPYFKGMEESTKTLMNKLITLVLGAIMVGLAFLFTAASGVIQAAVTVQSVVGGPALGIYILAMFVPVCSKRGALFGAFVGLASLLIISIGSNFEGTPVPLLPLSTEKCLNGSLDLKMTNVTSPTIPASPHPIFGISYTYYGALAALICVVSGLIATLVSGSEDLKELDPSLVLGCYRRFLPKKKSKGEKAEEACYDNHAMTHL